MQLIFDSTPFYGESGGQVGDRGWIEGNNFKANVIDVQKTKDIFIHFVEVVEGEAREDETYSLRVDNSRRLATAKIIQQLTFYIRL